MAVGADRPLIREFEDASSVHGKSGMEGFDFEEPTQQPLKENAVDAMRNVIMNSSEPGPASKLMNLMKNTKGIRVDGFCMRRKKGGSCLGKHGDIVIRGTDNHRQKKNKQTLDDHSPLGKLLHGQHK